MVLIRNFSITLTAHYKYTITSDSRIVMILMDLQKLAVTARVVTVRNSQSRPPKNYCNMAAAGRDWHVFNAVIYSDGMHYWFDTGT